MNTPNAPATREYHERTKLFPGANRPRRVDAGLVPKQYKRYVDLPAVALPPVTPSGKSIFSVLAGPEEVAKTIIVADLAAVLHYSAGIVRRSNVGGREVAFRAASCTGALYHIELYVVCGDIDGLAAGLYHFDVPSGRLRLMRSGDQRGTLGTACCDDYIATAGATFVLTSTFWRNAWRYEERAYRHVFWDAGTLLANLLAVSEGHSLRPTLYSAFVDGEVNALLGLDARREAAVAVVSLGAPTSRATASALSPLELKTEPLSRAEIEYPLIWQTHAATELAGCDAVQGWRRLSSGLPATAKQLPALEAAPLEETIERRGSARRFSQTPLHRPAFDAILGAARGSLRSDHARAAALLRPLLIVNHVEGIEAGAYSLDDQGADQGALSLTKKGDFSSRAVHLALDQPAAGNAAVNLYYVAHFDDVAAMGERGYRAVQLEAGIRTGQAYLASTALGLKVTGLTFYDEEVSTFFGLDPIEDIVLMLVVFGL